MQTRAGWIKHKNRNHEIVEVMFNPDVISFTDLLKHGKLCKSARMVFTRSDKQQKAALEVLPKTSIRTDDEWRDDKDPKFYLSRTLLKHMPLTEMQSMKINAAMHPAKKTDWKHLLSPMQSELLKTIEANPKTKWPIAIDKPVHETWKAANEFKKTLKADE
ncbi:hypothetical protein OAU50_00535 [Planctomycetota bacterium]|nr:hypothetical protein [Planctomycetota bacterium]